MEGRRQRSPPKHPRKASWGRWDRQAGVQTRREGEGPLLCEADPCMWHPSSSARESVGPWKFPGDWERGPLVSDGHTHPTDGLAQENVVEHRPRLPGSLAHGAERGAQLVGGVSQRGWGPPVSIRSWASAGQHRSQLQHLEESGKGLRGRAVAAWAPFRGCPERAGQRRPGRRPCGQTHQGHQCWFPSSQSHSLSAPASRPLPPAVPDLRAGRAAGHSHHRLPQRTFSPACSTGRGPVFLL